MFIPGQFSPGGMLKATESPILKTLAPVHMLPSVLHLNTRWTTRWRCCIIGHWWEGGWTGHREGRLGPGGGWRQQQTLLPYPVLPLDLGNPTCVVSLLHPLKHRHRSIRAAIGQHRVKGRSCSCGCFPGPIRFSSFGTAVVPSTWEA